MNHLPAALIELPFLPALLLKWTLLLVVAWAANYILRASNPRWRALVWRVTIVALAVLPLAERVMPRLDIPVPDQSVSRPKATTQIDIPPAQKLESAKTPLVSPVSIITEEKPQTLSLKAAGAAERSRILAAVWATVTLVLLAQMGRKFRGLRRSLLRAAPAPEFVFGHISGLALEMGFRRRLDVRVLDNLGSAFMTGVMRPVIVLPARFVHELDSERLRAVLAHELAHAKTNDAFWMMVARLTTCVLWFHPLAWRISAVHGTACEETCDSVAAKFVGSTESYSQILASEAIEVLAAGPVLGGVAMVRSAEIVERLRKIQRGIEANPLARRWVAAISFCGIVSIAILGSLRLIKAEETSDSEIITRIQARQEKIKETRLRIVYQRITPGPDGTTPVVHDCELLAHEGNYRESDRDGTGVISYRYFNDGLRVTHRTTDGGRDSLEYNPYHFVHHLDSDVALAWCIPTDGFLEAAAKRGAIMRGVVSPGGESCIWIRLGNNAYAYSEKKGFAWLAWSNPAPVNPAAYVTGEVPGVARGGAYRRYGADMWLPGELASELSGTIKISKIEIDADFDDARLVPPQPKEGWRVTVHYPLWRPDQAGSSAITQREFDWSGSLGPDDRAIYEVARAYWRVKDFDNALAEEFPLPYFDDKRQTIVWAQQKRVSQQSEVHVGNELPAGFGSAPWNRSDPNYSPTPILVAQPIPPSEEFLHHIPIETYEHDGSKFLPGDSIEILEVRGTEADFQMGHRYYVRGRYTLQSHDAAELHIDARNGELESEQGPPVTKGSGEFVRTFRLTRIGEPHVSFYPAGGGEAFGGTYFGRSGSSLRWMSAFNAVYSLTEGQALKRIAPPFIPERIQYYAASDPSQAKSMPDGPTFISFEWDGTLKDRNMGFSAGNAASLEWLLTTAIRVGRGQFDGPADILKTNVPGDWVVRASASEADRMQAVNKILRDELGLKINLELRREKRLAVVVTGSYQFKPLPNAPRNPNSVHLYADRLDSREGAGGGTGTMQDIFNRVEDLTHLQIYDETTSSPDVKVEWTNHSSVEVLDADSAWEKESKIISLLRNLNSQTGLDFSMQERPVDMWIFSKEK